MTQINHLDLTGSDVVANAHSKIDRAYVQTTNNTATTLATISVPEQTILVVLALVSGLNNDHSEGIGGHVTAAFRRDGGGNVTLIGSATVVSQEDSGGTPSFTMDADTTAQTARVRVTGETSKTIDWLATLQYHYQTT